MTDTGPAGSRREPTLAVPLAAAKNQLSALVARVEQGEEIAITRRGVPVVRMVPDSGEGNGRAGRSEQVALALERLQQLRSGVVLEGDLRLIAREGLRSSNRRCGRSGTRPDAAARATPWPQDSRRDHPGHRPLRRSQPRHPQQPRFPAHVGGSGASLRALRAGMD